MATAPGSRTVRVGLLLFALGSLFILADVLPFFFGDHNRPLWLNLACLLAPLGLAVAVGSVIRAGRADQRYAVDELGQNRSAG